MLVDEFERGAQCCGCGDGKIENWNIEVDTHGLTPVALEIPIPDQKPNSN